MVRSLVRALEEEPQREGLPQLRQHLTLHPNDEALLGVAARQIVHYLDSRNYEDVKKLAQLSPRLDVWSKYVAVLENVNRLREELARKGDSEARQLLAQKIRELQQWERNARRTVSKEEAGAVSTARRG